jgi:hypothetical protein
MRKILTCGALALSVALGSCGTTGGSVTITVNDVVAKVQAIAVKVCGFLPTASTVINIVSAGSPIAATAESIAQSICAAVSAVPKLGARLSGAAPPVIMVNGVQVHGRFVR